MNLRRRNVLYGFAALPAGALLGRRPLPGLTATVYNGHELHAALQAAGPGSVIELAPGDYGDVGGRFRLGAGGGVSLRAQAARRAVLRAPVVVEDDRAAFEDLAFADGVHLAADGLSITGSVFTGTGLRVTGAGTIVSNCEFVAIRGQGLSISGSARGAIFRDNYFHDPVGGAAASAAIQVGLNTADTNTRIGIAIERNLFERWKSGSETVSVKSSGVVFRDNTLRDCKNLTNRHGEENNYLNNVLERCAGLVVHDRGTRLFGNRLVSTPRGIRVMGGNVAPEVNIQGKHPHAANTLLVGNVGKLVIGALFAGHTLPAVNTQVVSHEGAIQLLAAQTGTTLPPGATPTRGA